MMRANRMLAPVALAAAGSCLLGLKSSHLSAMESSKVDLTATEKSSYIMFLGTGSSTGCPKPSCLYPSNVAPPYPCAVSKLAAIGDPRHNKNYRNNPSLLISYTPPATSVGPLPPQSILLDCGKTFRESLLRFLPPSLRSISAVVLTHEHCDAYGGLDDLRGAQLPLFDASRRPAGLQPIPVFLNEQTMAVVKRVFPYLVNGKGWWDAEEKVEDKKEKEEDAKKEFRLVATLDYKQIKPFQPFFVGDGEGKLKITPLPVVHGEDCVCLAFVFGEKERVLYMSDVSRIPPETMDWLNSNLLLTDVLVLDCLFEKGKHNTHFCLDDAIEFIKLIRPKKTLLVGISCDSFPDHDLMNEKLLAMFPPEGGMSVQFAHDGLKVAVDL